MTSNVTFQHVPEQAYQPSRRHFLKRFAGGVAAAGLLPAFGFSGDRRARGTLAQQVGRLAPGQVGDEDFWRLVKDQFPLRPGLILMNAANLCPSPYPVAETVFHYTRDIDADASSQNRGKFKDLHEAALEALARYMGADTDEVVITRNTSEGNNLVIAGLDLGAGDEVVLWDQNHPSNNVAWDVRAQRHGFTVKHVATPADPQSSDDLIEPFAEALTANTRVLSFSHVSNVSGVGLPAKALCAIARERGILTLIDGAQTFGVHQINLHEIGCDFYTGSAHKWFLGPKEGGLLYVRRERVDVLWPSVVGVGWEKAREQGARKFGTMGQRDDAMLAAVGKTVEFLETIGNDRIEARVRELAAALKDLIREHLPQAEFRTPLSAELSGGVVIFTLPDVDFRAAFASLYEEHHIGCAVMGGNLRLCPHIYNTMDEVERVVEVVKGLA